ncbi:glycosyltransferase family 4 protein [Shinella curvata]|uniref:Glycosyltransferase family 4 protein n=1 Tax=Shinella curvata TaxID=1817964 RepID=A0ABT8XID4_9HYPH|nr:glycosyltransferase family 4 protein [Shinella curvata]MCJ8055941.1 glycosyltransferase family 4 protein [Shinella curvata]MDO6123458.1 glycosyltransferase family 4 protein [Shinella curvata]
MKIIQVQTQAEAGGAQRISDMLGEGLRARGHEARTVFLYRKTDVYDGNPHADFILPRPPNGPVGQIRAVLGLVGYMRKARPDAVLSFQHYGNIAGTFAARLCGVRTIVVNQSGAPQRRGIRGILTWIDRLMGVAGLYHVNVVNSLWTGAQFARFPAAYRKRLNRIDHGVASPVGSFDKLAARAGFGLPAGATIVLSSGRLASSKNQAALVAALALMPGVHLAIAGAGPEEGNLLALADVLHVRGRLHLVGEVPPARIFEFLAAGDAYAFASTTETFGLAVVEAAISGLPVVAGALDVLKEVLTTVDGQPAALFVSPDAEGIAGGLVELFSSPPRAAALSSAGRKLREQYAPEAMCAAYEALLLAGHLGTATIPSITSSAPQRLSV